MFHAKLKVMGVASALLVAATFAVFAQTAPAPQPGAAVPVAKGKGAMAACREDIKSLCGTVARKGGARMKCLVENKAKASAACQATIASVETQMAEAKASRKEARKQVRDLCRIDAKALCSTVEKGKGGRMKCLRDNVAKLSPACAQAVAAVPVRKRDASATPKAN